MSLLGTSLDFLLSLQHAASHRPPLSLVTVSWYAITMMGRSGGSITEMPMRPSAIPEGSLIASIMSTGPGAKCHPLDDSECDSWHTFGLGVILMMPNDESVPIVYPLCKKHFHAYIDDVLFNRDVVWSDTRTED